MRMYGKVIEAGDIGGHPAVVLEVGTEFQTVVAPVSAEEARTWARHLYRPVKVEVRPLDAEPDEHVLLHALLWACADPYAAAATVKRNVVQEYLHTNGWERDDWEDDTAPYSETWHKGVRRVRIVENDEGSILDAAQTVSWDESRGRLGGPGDAIVLAWWIYLSTRPAETTPQEPVHGAPELVKCDRCPAEVPETSVRIAEWHDADGQVHMGLVCGACRSDLSTHGDGR